jgi:pentalenene oxygenase
MSATAAPTPATRHPNGVRGLLRFGPNPLRELERLRDDGRPLVPFSLGPMRGHLVTGPEDIRAVLHEDWPPLSRGRLMNIDRWYSGGLILTEGEEHDRQRDELWAPLTAASPGPRIAEERAGAAAERWLGAEPVEVFEALRALCWSVEWESLTGEEMPGELIAAQERGVAAMVWLLGPFGSARWAWPVPGSARTRAARRRLDAAIDRLIAERRAQPRDDLLSGLVEREPDDDVVRASVKQWLGADQLHGALTWTLHLLSAHPEAEERFHAEVDAAAGVDALVYTRRVLKEAMRLYPPIWGFFRELTAETRVGEQMVPAGHVLALSPWATHRDPRLWPDPERFDPERWAEGAERPPEISYFPFSAGPYGCPGHGLAMSEAVLILAALGRRAAFRPTSSRPPRPVTTGTIMPRGGLRMQAVPR